MIAERLRGLDPKDSLAEQIDLGILARRLRMKSDGSRWAARRRRLLDDPSVDYESQVEPDDREIIRRAKEIPGCFLWTNSPNSPCPHDLSAFDVLAECYANAAAAVELVHRLDEQRVPFSDPALQKAFQLLGEAQSALRVAVANAGGPEDSDQFLVFQWLKANTRDREIYVARHMRISDPADPAAWPDLAERIAELGRLVEIGRLESGS
ncbi:MAG TPA: hypothetical protein VGN57_09050 [Pirellulaceae bacterium]|nr:hypothetical protein [Pirellulaceae bacterium]